MDEQRGSEVTPLERGLYGALGAGLLLAGVRSRSALGTVLLGGAGAGLAWMAAQGKNPLAPALKIETARGEPGEVVVRDAVTVQGDAGELYAAWRDLANLPRLMTHLKAVQVLDGNRSRWTVAAPTGETSWEAEITADEPGRRLAWQSIPGTGMSNSGEVRFKAAPGDRGTEVVVRLGYAPPLGSTGAVVARLFGQEPAQQLRDDLMRFKRERELGFAPTTQGQSHGQRPGGVL